MSHEHRFIFIHVPKTAGLSVARVLRPYDSQQPRIGFRRFMSHVPVPESPHNIAFRIHATARWVQLKLPRGIFHSYLRFAVVRNPFDRAVSYYHYLLQRADHHSHRRVRELSFDDYLAFLHRRRFTNDPTQLARVGDGKGGMLCNHLLRFESLHRDFDALCRLLRLPEGISLPSQNASIHRPYRDYYAAPQTRKRLVDIFAADFAAFGYDTSL